MQGENDNIDINHDMFSKLKGLHVMLQDHIPKSRHWEHALCFSKNFLWLFILPDIIPNCICNCTFQNWPYNFWSHVIKSIAGQMANPVSQCFSLFSFTNPSAWFLWFLSLWWSSHRGIWFVLELNICLMAKRWWQASEKETNRESALSKPHPRPV